jgi:hypothetical protein
LVKSAVVAATGTVPLTLPERQMMRLILPASPRPEIDSPLMRLVWPEMAGFRQDWLALNASRVRANVDIPSKNNRPFFCFAPLKN